jgi:type IV secretory pathway VirD2 relaxase
MKDDEFRIRPGKGRSRGGGSVRQARSLVAQIARVANKAGYTRLAPGVRRAGGTGQHSRGRRAALTARFYASNRRVVIKARIVRHSCNRFRSAPLARHTAYLERDGVTRDGQDAKLFGESTECADGKAFAARCEDDRHHFRFIVSPEDGGDLADLRSFTREFMADVAHDLDTRLDWVAVDHWNTDNPHVHILVRGVDNTSKDLIIDRHYITQGMRARAEERVTIELGPRSEREIASALAREVDAERWTSLDCGLQRLADESAGIIDLRPDNSDPDPERHRLMVGRAMKLERLGLAEQVSPAIWSLKSGLESTLREMSLRGDIIKTMHRALISAGHTPDLSGFAIHGEAVSEPVLGRLVERGLHDELSGTAYAIIDGADGRTHHIAFNDLEMTGDAKPGAIVELRSWEGPKAQQSRSLATRSDLSLITQVTAPGATWLDRQLITKEPIATGHGFGCEIRDAKAARADYLIAAGLAQRKGQQMIFAQGLLDTLKTHEIEDAARRIVARTGHVHKSSVTGNYVTGVFRERVTLASGRFAMIDDGVGFQLVPWRPTLDQHFGQHVTGTMTQNGSVDWSFVRKRGLGH